MVGVRFALVILIAATGCKQVFGLDEPGQRGGVTDALGPDPDGRADDAVRTIDGAACYGTGLVRACFGTPPSLPVTLSGTIDTDAPASCVMPTTLMGGPACVIAGAPITVVGTLSAHGSRPLVLISAGGFELDQGVTIDVASRHAGSTGAGATTCGGNTSGSISGGGAGGSFGATGGDGGDGANGGSPGNAAAPIVPTTVRGGCKGGDGGNATDSGGAGGGGVFVIASGTISIAGTINASGAGGISGQANSRGGGGGGSGGMIGLDGTMVMVGGTANVFANGGGGAEGAGAGSTGDTGDDPTGPTNTPNGGSGTNGNAGDGGDGGYFMTNATRGGTGASSAGGGGGGGSVGIVKVYGVATGTTTGHVSPLPN